jgi:hypothetical protein
MAEPARRGRWSPSLLYHVVARIKTGIHARAGAANMSAIAESMGRLAPDGGVSPDSCSRKDSCWLLQAARQRSF